MFFKDVVTDFTVNLMLNSEVRCSGRLARDLVLAKYAAYRYLVEKPSRDLKEFVAGILARLGVGEWDEMRRLFEYFGYVTAHTLAHVLYAEASALSSRGAVRPVYGAIRHHNRRLYYAGIVDVSGVDVVYELATELSVQGGGVPEAGLARIMGTYTVDHPEGFEAGGRVAEVFRELGLAPDPHTVAVLSGAGVRGLRSCLDVCGDTILVDECREGVLQPLLTSTCVLKVFLVAIGAWRTEARLLVTSYALRSLALAAADVLEVTTAYTTAEAIDDLENLLRRGVSVKLTLDERCLVGRDGPQIRSVLRRLKQRYPRLFRFEYAIGSHAKVLRIDDLKIDTSWNYSRIPKGSRVRYAERPVKQSVSPTYLPLLGRV